MRGSSPRKMSRAGALAALICVSSSASAATSTGTLSTTATVAGACIIGNATLAFGTYNPTSLTAATATTTVIMTCTLGTPYNIGMSAGLGVGATTLLRIMTASGGSLGYALYRDSGFTLNWGNTLATDTLAGISLTSSLSNTINIYAQIPPGELAATGSYSDTVTMTVTY